MDDEEADREDEPSDGISLGLSSSGDEEEVDRERKNKVVKDQRQSSGRSASVQASKRRRVCTFRH